jgi:hypothetical protein
VRPPLDTSIGIASTFPGTGIQARGSVWYTARQSLAGAFFHRMARSVLRSIRVTGNNELTQRIKRCIEFCNDVPLVPKWSYGINRDPRPLAA